MPCLTKFSDNLPTLSCFFSIEKQTADQAVFGQSCAGYHGFVVIEKVDIFLDERNGTRQVTELGA